MFEITLADGKVLKLDLTHEQARELIARLQQALALGPQVATPN